MSQLPPGFVLDAPTPAAPVSAPVGPIMGPPPKPEKPDKPDGPKTTYRTLSPDEIKQRGLATGSYQISSEGKVDAVGSGDAKPTEYQAKSSGFYGRMMQAEQNYGGVGGDKLAPRGMVRQSIHENFPNAENSFLNDSTRQGADQAARNFIAAQLRLESGAAISPQEYENQYRIFFPMPGDTADTIAQKAAARKQAVEAMKLSAGPLADDAAGTLQPNVGANGVDKKDVMAATVAAFGHEYYDKDGNPLGPDGEQAYDKDGNYLGLVGKVTDDSPEAPKPPPTAGDQIKAGVGDLVQGAGDVLGIINNPLNATINAVTGSHLTTDTGETLRGMTGLPHGDKTAEMINRLGVGAFLPSVAAGRLAEYAPGVVGGALRTVASNPLREMAAGAGAGAGSEAGKDYGAPGQIIGGVIGGVLGHTASGIPGAVKGALSAERAPNAVMAAADRQNVTMMPADVGGTGTRMASGVVGRTLGEIPMSEGAQGALATATNARNRVASNIGTVADETGAGQAAQRGAKAWVAHSDTRGGQLYDAIPVPSDAPATLEATRSTLADVIRGFTSNPRLSKIWTGHPQLRATLEALTPVDVSAAGRAEFAAANEKLAALKGQYETLRNTVIAPAKLGEIRAQIGEAEKAVIAASEKANRPPEGGKLSWEDMKRLRSIVGEIVGDPSLTSDGNAKGAMRKLYGALSQDMEATATQAGPKALDAFQKANRYWRGRQDRIDNVLSGILGDDLKKGETAAFEQINRWAQTKGGDFKNLSRALRSMPPEEANTVRATVVSKMGQASPGRQNADGLEFSPAEFVTQWNRISPRAKTVLFPNEQHRADMDDLATVFANMKRAGEYSNVSKTSLSANAAGHGALAMTGIPGLLLSGGAAGAEFGFGKLLASPRFARWLASSPVHADPGQIQSYAERLGKIAIAEPLIASDVKAVQEYLRQSISQSPVRAAATTEKEQDRRRVPPQ